MERLIEKVVRHLNDGGISPSEVTSGIKMAIDEVVVRNEKAGIPILVDKKTDYMGNRGLTVLDYIIAVPPVLYTAGFNSYRELHRIPVRLYSFPQDIQIDHVTTNHDNSQHTDSDVFLGKNGFLSFTGPTYVDGVPNNGYWSSTSEISFPFGEVPFEGDRRGAIAFQLEGGVRVVTDDEKKAMIASNFEGLHSLVAGSFFFSSQDDVHDNIFCYADYRTHLSYFVSYGDKTCGFILSNQRAMSRRMMKRILDHSNVYLDKNGYMACEMEYTGASCVVKGQDGNLEKYGGRGFGNRVDHYFVRRN